MLRLVIIFIFIIPKLIHSKPHVIIITADDMGRNDVSYHGSNIFMTPNIDALAYNGVILNDFHTASLCTPSRSALMTGRYPISNGMQHSVILEAEPWGLPLDSKILPQWFKSAGYDTHLVGKWHLGFFQEEYTPTKRGFDSFYGFWQGHHDYFSHYSEETFGSFNGYDMRNNFTVDWEAQNKYSTDLFTERAVNLIGSHNPDRPMFLYLSQIAPHAGTKIDPLQVPPEEIKKFEYIPDEPKKKYAAMMSKLDKSVGSVMEALQRKNMLENSIILFMSDNGAPTVGIYSTTGSNYPFRGIKATEWEGGTRVPAIIWSPLLGKQQRITNIMMHMVDILPTLYAAIGMNPQDIGKISGINMWETLSKEDKISPREEYPYNIDPADDENSVGAVRVGDWKYFVGNTETVGKMHTWHDDQNLEIFMDDRKYDVDVILHSKTGLAIQSVQQKLNTELNKYETIKDDDKVLLTGEKILQLRSSLKVKCSKSENKPICKPHISPCLINLKKDPCEMYNLALENPKQAEVMRLVFEKYRKNVVKPLNIPKDTNADPCYWGDVWINWYDFRDEWSCKKLICKFKEYVQIVKDSVARYI